jgi:hypothetical protein
MEKSLIVTELVKKLPIFYGTPRFITMFIRVHHWTLNLNQQNPAFTATKEYEKT